jgi:RluA family pseudouridine synthase
LSSPATNEFWELPVLFEDNHLLALNKPACLLTSPDRYDPLRPNLMKLLHAGIAAEKPWARERKLTYLANAHRLDFETTGVLLLAKNKPCLIALADLFGSDKPNKTYVALVPGNPPAQEWEVSVALGPHPGRPGRMRVDPKGGKHSRTRFTVRESFQSCALIECRPFTGRTHQIRVHMRHSHRAIFGDSFYGGASLLLSHLKSNYRLKPGREERPLIVTLALHAERLSLLHPVTGAPVDIEAPWPKDFHVALKYLRRYDRPISVPEQE